MSTFITFAGRVAAAAALTLSVSTAAVGQTTYQLDDGTAENAVGLSSGGVIAGINYFDVTGGNNVITSMSVAWGTPAFAGLNGIVAGSPFSFHVWRNAGAGTNPTGLNSVLLFSGSSTISASNIDNNSFQMLDVPNIAIDGGSFFVGVALAHAAGTFPIGVDQTPPTTTGVSWAAGGASFDPNDVRFGAGDAIDAAAAGLGMFMIRATATSVPEPATYTLLLAGLAGLGTMARMRRR